MGARQAIDFTGKGLPDLAAGIAKMPPEPRQTLTDDPPRVLRLIWFPAKLRYCIDSEAKKGMNDPESHP